MGIYYYAIDHSSKEHFDAPRDFSIKSPGFFHPHNPFPGMVMMMNFYGSRFELENDAANEIPDGYKDITEEVYHKYIGMFDCAKKFYEKDGGS